MKKLITIAIVAILGLMLSGCRKEPTNVTFKYKVPVSGSVKYDNDNFVPAGFLVTITVSGAPHTLYSATTDGSGKFSITIPSVKKSGISVSAQVDKYIKDNMQYSSVEPKTGTVTDATGATITGLDLKLKKPVSLVD